MLRVELMSVAEVRGGNWEMGFVFSSFLLLLMFDVRCSIFFSFLFFLLLEIRDQSIRHVHRIERYLAIFC
jgi:hypothetical protein